MNKSKKLRKILAFLMYNIFKDFSACFAERLGKMQAEDMKNEC